MKLSLDKTFKSKTERAMYCISVWLSYPKLLQAIVDNHLEWILYQTHAKYEDYLKKIYPIPFEDDKRSDYFFAVLSSLICGSLSVYFKHQTDPVLDAYKTINECLAAIVKVFDPEE